MLKQPISKIVSELSNRSVEPNCDPAAVLSKEPNVIVSLCSTLNSPNQSPSSRMHLCLSASLTLSPEFLSSSSWLSVQPPPATAVVGTSNSHRLLLHFSSIAQQPSQPSFPSITQPPCEHWSLRPATATPPVLALFHRSYCPVRSPFEGVPCLCVSLLRAPLF
ncbi:uncharacterized protein DS421_3g71480 [Arachis hypogaea]|nr:uncharacterized protein DS421_3g71480 [Arachis hypogaea]